MAWRRGQAYGQDLRDWVLACSDMTSAEVATRFGVSSSYVSKVRARLRVLGDAAPGPQHNHVAPRLAPLMDAIRGQVAAEPDAKLRAWLVQAHNVCVSHAVLWKAMARWGICRMTPPTAAGSAIAMTDLHRPSYMNHITPASGKINETAPVGAGIRRVVQPSQRPAVP